MTKFFFILTMCLLFSCGKKIEEEVKEGRSDQVAADGTYSAILLPINGNISGRVHGNAKVAKYGDTFHVSVHLRDAPSGTFAQYLHTGSMCPNQGQDLNNDGHIDGYEARHPSGLVIVPLDGDLGSQYGGHDMVLSGSYNYSRTTSYALMLSDLHLPDDVINDYLTKLKERDLPLERKVVLIYQQNVRSPSTLTGSELPIACGVLTKVGDYPGPDDGWDNSPTTPPPEEPPRPRPLPLPDPPPRPLPPEDRPDTWWDWARDRVGEWSDRIGGWWRDDGNRERPLPDGDGPDSSRPRRGEGGSGPRTKHQGPEYFPD